MIPLLLLLRQASCHVFRSSLSLPMSPVKSAAECCLLVPGAVAVEECGEAVVALAKGSSASKQR